MPKEKNESRSPSCPKKKKDRPMVFFVQSKDPTISRKEAAEYIIKDIIKRARELGPVDK